MGVFFLRDNVLTSYMQAVVRIQGGQVGEVKLRRVSCAQRRVFVKLQPAYACSGNFTVMQVADTTVHGAVH